MTAAEIHDAVWSARLLAEGKVILLSPETVLAICKALVHVNETTIVPPLMLSRPNAEPVLFTDGMKVTP